MEHVVFFPAQDGSPAFCRVPSLEEAVRLVEHLRNVEGVAEASVHALTEVPLAFRAYYKVEVPSGAAAPAAATPVVEELVPAQAEAPEPVAHEQEQEEPAEAVLPEPVLVPAAASGHGAASLGFFA